MSGKMTFVFIQAEGDEAVQAALEAVADVVAGVRPPEETDRELLRAAAVEAVRICQDDGTLPKPAKRSRGK